MSIFEGTHPLFKQVPPIGPLSTTAVLKPFSTAVDATIMPEPVPITRTSKRSTEKPSRFKKKTGCQINFSIMLFTSELESLLSRVPRILKPVMIMSKVKKAAEEEKKKKVYYQKKEKKAAEVKKK